MKDFDVIRAERVNADRTFRLAGEDFTFRASVGADQLAQYEDAMVQVTASATDLLAAMDSYILACLEPGQDEKWRTARNGGAELPVSVGDMRAVIDHINEVITGRPTGKPSDSSTQPSTTGTESTAASPSTAGKRKG